MLPPQPQRIVLPEALDPRILKAAAELLRRGQARIILLGQQEAVQVHTEPAGIDLRSVQVLPTRPVEWRQLASIADSNALYR